MADIDVIEYLRKDEDNESILEQVLRECKELGKQQSDTKQNRKVVQMLICDNNLIVLCNDGTMWQKEQYSWSSIENVPQGK